MIKPVDVLARSLFATAVLSTALAACAQVPPPPPRAVAAPPVQGPADGLPPAPAAAVQQLDGTVKTYLVNEFGDVDGFVAQDGTAVRFPPHMGADLVDTLKPGDRFVAQGTAEAWGRFRAFSLGKRGSAVVLNESRPTVAPRPPLPPEARAAALVPMQVSGTVTTVLYAPQGEIDGFVTNDGTLVRLPPGTTATARVGSRIQASGAGTTTAYGRGMRADTLSVDGQAIAAFPPRAAIGLPPGRRPPMPDAPVPPTAPAAPGSTS